MKFTDYQLQRLDECASILSQLRANRLLTLRDVTPQNALVQFDAISSYDQKISFELELIADIVIEAQQNKGG